MRRRIGTSYNKQSTSDTTSDMIVSVNRQITVCTCWQTSSRALHARSSLPSSRFARTNHRLASHGRTIVSFRTDEPSSRFARTNHRPVSHGRTIVSFRTDEPSSRFARTNHRLVSHGRTIVSFRTDEPSSRFARTNHRLVSHGRTIVSFRTDEPFRTDNHFSSGRPRSLPCLDRDVLCDAIVTHLYQAHVYIIVVDTLLLSVSLSERRRQRMFSNPSTVSKHYRSDGSLTDSA